MKFFLVGSKVVLKSNYSFYFAVNEEYSRLYSGFKLLGLAISPALGYVLGWRKMSSYSKSKGNIFTYIFVYQDLKMKRSGL